VWGSRGRRHEPWTHDELWHVSVRACTGGGGGGMSQNKLRKLYQYTKAVEASTDAAKKPFTDTFRTAYRFIAAVRRFKRALVAPLNWKKVYMSIDGRRYTVCYREALVAAQYEIMRAMSGDLYWGPTPSTEAEAQSMETSTNAPKKALRGAWNGEMYKEQNDHVQGTLSSGTRVLGLHLYSDSTVLSNSGAVSAYPLRMRVINTTTKEVRWVTVAPPGRGWCRGTAWGEPGSGGHDPHRQTGLVSPRGTGIAPTLGLGPCGACNPAWRRAAAAGGPARGGGYVGRRALPRGRATGHHVRYGRPVPIPPSLYLPHWGTCLALYLVVLVGRRRGPIPIRGIGPTQRFPPF